MRPFAKTLLRPQGAGERLHLHRASCRNRVAFPTIDGDKKATANVSLGTVGQWV